MTATLVLHWHLDEVIHEDGVLDASDNHLNGTVEGAPKNMPDEAFGSCLVLDGRADALTLPATPLLGPAAYTVEAWINPVAGRTDTAVVAGTPAQAFVVSLTPNGSLVHSSRASVATSPAGTVRDGVWQHVAATADDTALRVYLNGTKVVEVPRLAAPAGPRDALVVGRAVDGRTKYYGGRLAHVRVYDGALTDDEIALDIAEDQAELGAFVRTHPIEFELANQDTHHVLYIDDSPSGQLMTLTLTNSSRQEITLQAPTGAVSAQNYHLALQFRDQTLAAVPAPALATPGWSLLRPADGDTLYLLAVAAATLAPGASTRITLQGMNADGRGGTRGTRVELAYQQMAFTGEVEQLIGTRLQFLDIVNHRGRTDLPVHVSFVGGNRVLSDGATPSSLRLRIANLSQDSPVPVRGAAGNADGATAIVVAFDLEGSGQSRDWALVTAGAAQATGLAVTAASAPGTPGAMWPPPVRDLVGQQVQWRLTPAQDGALAPGGWIELTLSGVIAPLSIGQASVYVNFINLPGYADGSVTVGVEKSPLLFTSSADGSVQRVAIGTVAPMAALHLIDPPSDANGGSLILGSLDVSNLRLGHHRDYSWIQSHGSKPLALNQIGNNVGIGTTTPGSALTVSAASSHLQLARMVTNPPGGNLLFLELFQAQGPVQVNPSIRFHHSNAYWHRIEARAEGFLLKTGDLTSDAMVDLYAQTARVQELQLAGMLFQQREAEILAALAAGELQVDLFDFPNNRSLGTVTLRLTS